MKKLLEFIPALICFLYFEGWAYLITSDDDSPMDLAPKLVILTAPILSFLLVTILFWCWGAFGRRFTRFIRSMLVVLATAGAIGVFETISFCLPSSGGIISSPFFVIFGVATTSLFWLPFTLVIASVYCLPLWVWEGRHDLNHLAQRLARAVFRHRFLILGILAVGIATGAFLLTWDHWRQIPTEPSWVVSAPKDRPFRLTSGWAPDGTEVVVAHAVARDDPHAESDIVSLDARNGHVRWEQRAESAFTAIIDPDRNVVYAGDGAVVTKLSGADGRLLWQQRVAETAILAVGLFPPVADQMGQIWVSGNKQYRNDESYRFLALLEAGDGKVRWEKTQAPEKIGALDPARIFPLKGGDAFSVLPPFPYGFGGKRAWIMQRLSGKSGDVLWEVDPPSDAGDNTADVHWLVDEPHGQVVVFSGRSPQGAALINLVAYDLLTGKEKWHAVNPAPIAGIGPGGVNMSFDDHGNLVLWYSARDFSRSWFTYCIMFSPLVFFDLSNNYAYRNHNFRIVLSITDGRILDCQEFGGLHEELFTVLSSPGTGPPGTVIMQVRKPNNGLGSWRAILLNHGALPNQGELPLFARQPRGPEANWTYNGDAVVTPSGKLVICDFKDGWQIRAW